MSRGKELQQLRTIRFIICPPCRVFTSNTHIGIRNKNGLYVVHNYPNILILIDLLIVANKPRGLQAARKLRNTRRDNRWVRFPLGLPCKHILLILGMNCGGTLILRI